MQSRAFVIATEWTAAAAATITHLKRKIYSLEHNLYLYENLRGPPRAIASSGNARDVGIVLYRQYTAVPLTTRNERLPGSVTGSEKQNTIRWSERLEIERRNQQNQTDCWFGCDVG